MKEYIHIDPEMRQSRTSLEKFAKIQKKIIESENPDYTVIDIIKYKYIHPSFAVLLASLPYLKSKKLEHKPVSFLYNKKNSKSIEFLTQSGMLQHYSKDLLKGKSEKSIPFDTVKDLDSASESINQILKNAPVELSEDLSNVLFSKMYEIFSNSFTHAGNDKKVFCCGYSTYDNFTFSVYDTGIGIYRNVKDYLNDNLIAVTPKFSLQWAFKEGNSTLNGKVDYPRGAGLNLLANFANINHGKLLLASDAAYAIIQDGQRKFYDLDCPIIGTLFSMTIISDRLHKYILKRNKEANP